MVWKEGNEPVTESVLLIAWMINVNSDALCSQQHYQASMTRRGTIKWVHCFLVHTVY